MNSVSVVNEDNVPRIGDSLVTECGQYGVVDFIDGEYVGVTWNKGCPYSECTSKEHASKVTKVKQLRIVG